MLRLRWPPTGESWPLTDRSALALLEAWLAPNDGAVRHELRQALTADAGLRSWSTYRASPSDIESLDALEAWWLKVGPEAFEDRAFEDRASAGSTPRALVELEATTTDQHSGNGACPPAQARTLEVAHRFLRALPRLAAWRRLESRFDQTLEAERLASLAEFAAAAGHEINNPLGVIVGRAQQLLAAEADSERRQSLAAIRTAAWRVREMIADLMLFARPPQPRLERLDLAVIVAPLEAELAPLAAARSLRLSWSRESVALPITADSLQLAVALRAVIVNALEWAPSGGWVQVALETESDGGLAVIRVSDNGPGFSDEARRHAFDPFYSGRQAGRGLGLGLSKAWRILQSHGGSIQLGQPDRGAEVRIGLPLRRDVAAAETPEGTTSTASTAASCENES